jgi:[ribosomal protein S5]-alanine N-acetyltransferase
MRLLPEIITTERLRLRAPSMADAATIFQAYAQDPQVCQYMIWLPHTSQADTEAFIASCIQAWDNALRFPYVITRTDSDTAIGMLEARAQGSTIDIGYVLARTHWGQALVPEAIQALTNAALQQPSIFRVQATCDTNNIASQRALEKSGFIREARLERYTVHPNISPEPRACFMYARCK